ncbi:ATP-binding protein [Streptomyces sp. AM 4-1-1]|uniref:ATP-binding protein n=1 Tax=Streptomyces sp. AM 4-1-1 TaxID=3028710 RepID=UPI0031B9EF42
MGRETCGAVVLRWSRHARCVGLARKELRDALGCWDLSALEDAALLVLSELLTNAGRHARVSPGRQIETRFIPVGCGVRIEVHDASPVLPEEREAGPEACDGRGLALVEALADKWGYGDRSGPGKVVWAELATDGRDDPAATAVPVGGCGR